MPIKQSKLDRHGEQYYVYRHYDPDTNETVYIGKGSGGRAWDARPTTRGNNGGSEAHCEWICEQVLDRKEFVEVLATRLFSGEALRFEELLREQLNPKFNTA